MAEGASNAQAPASARPTPARIGRYDILLPIASGGMATVYLARSRGARGFERQVALKVTHAHLLQEREFASIVLDEARLASRVRHRNVVSILDVGEDPLGLFLVMEYVEGDTLSGLLRRGTTHESPLPARFGMRILLDALAGLHAAHELRDDAGNLLGVVHRDFSPQNILVGLDGVAQLTDFGIAKAANVGEHTETGIIKGKVAYMAPEQVRGLRIDRRADVWSAGVVAWELLAGRKLFGTGDGMATMLKIVQEDVPRLRSVRPEIPEEVDAAVAGALEKDRDKRTPTASAFARSLSNAFGLMARVAEPEELAEFVSAAVAPKLATRRSQVQDVLKLRARLDALAEESISSTQSSPVALEGMRARLPSDDAETARAPSVAALGMDEAAATEASDTRPTPIASQAVPEVHTSLTDTTSTSETLQRLPGAGRRRLLVGGSAALVAVVSVVGIAMSSGHGEVAADPASSPVLSVSATPAPSDVPVPAAPEVAKVDPNIIHLHANVAVSEVRVNGRKVVVDGPARELSIRLLDAERSTLAKLVVTSVDGRHTTASLRPDAMSLDLDFAPRATPPSAPAHPRPALAPSPYD